MANGRYWLAVPLSAGIVFSTVSLAQRAVREYPREFREYPGETYSQLPSDWNVPGEFVVGRLMYPSLGGGGSYRGGGTNWTIDYPQGDRTFASILRRLTLVDVRSVEQPIDLDDGDDVFNWPFLLAIMPSNWDLTDAQAAKLREYLLRGGFLMADSFFGDGEWFYFMESMRRVFPDRPVIELPDDHALFNVVYDFSERHQIRNFRTLPIGYRGNGDTPSWRAILDDDGRIMVAISFNNDMGDSWQHADNPAYPQEDSFMGLRLGVNYVVYTMSH